MNIKFYLSFILIVLGVNLQSQGQVSYGKRIGGPIGEAPKVSNVGNNYSLDNVDLNTGTVNINIPLYEVRAHDITVPVSLNYSALGIRVGQEAGAPGMGWELNAGGKINRQINGLNDETTPAGNKVNSEFDFSLDPDNNLSDRNKLRDVAIGNYDYAYDTYSYSVPSGSGRFTKNGLTFPYDPTFKYNSYAGREIITGDGLKHEFTSGDHILVSTKKYYKQKNDGTYNLEEIPGGMWVTKDYDTDYNLHMITSPKSNDTVKFEYQMIQSSGPFAGIIGRTRTTHTEMIALNRDLGYNTGVSQWQDTNGAFYFLGEPVLSETKIETVTHYRIKSITYPTGKVDFEYRATDLLGRDVLTKVKIYQKINGIYKRLKQYQFNYDTDETYGHYLKNLDVLDADSVRSGLWKFNYAGYYGGKVPVVPSVGSFAQDRWGFYNGATGNRTLIEHPNNMINMNERQHLNVCVRNYPGAATDFFTYNRPENVLFYNGEWPSFDPKQVNFANRNTNAFYLTHGTISNIRTPTGETVYYDYEPHKFYVHGYDAAHRQVYEGGGIRVKSITHSDGAMFSGRTLSKKSFTYGMGTYNSPADTEIGHGIVNIPGVITNTKYCYQYNSNVSSIDNALIYSHPLNDLAISKGSFAHYPSVTESTMTGPYISHQTVYYFSNSAPTGPWTNLYVTNNPYYPNFPETYINQGVKADYTDGQPLQIIEYNGLRTNNTKARVTINSYTNYTAPSSSPKLYSFFGGIRGMKIGNYTTSLMVCACVTGTQCLQFDCTWLGTMPNMDPLGYLTLGPEDGTEYYPGRYFGTTNELSTLSNVYKLTGTTTTTYNRIYVDPFVTTTKTHYDNINHMQPTRIVTFTSHGEPKTKRIKYAHDFPNNTISGVDLLRSKNIMTVPVEELSMTGDISPYVMAGVKHTFSSYNNLVVKDGIFRLNPPKLFPLSGYSESSPYYEPAYSFNTPDEMGNLTLVSKANGPKTATVWGYNQQYPVAEITNVSSTDEVAFTNFQSDDKSIWKGYWSYSGVPVLDITSPSSDKVYKLETGAITKTLPPSGKKYTLAYWYKFGTTVNVTGVTVGSEVIKNKKGNWVFAEREITAGTALSISGTGSIDELRLCPVESMMTTYTYNPGVGISRTQDEKGQSVTYEYDSEQHLRLVRDQQGNILKGYEYHIGNVYKQ